MTFLRRGVDAVVELARRMIIGWREVEVLEVDGVGIEKDRLLVVVVDDWLLKKVPVIDSFLSLFFEGWTSFWSEWLRTRFSRARFIPLFEYVRVFKIVIE